MKVDERSFKRTRMCTNEHERLKNMLVNFRSSIYLINTPIFLIVYTKQKSTFEDKLILVLFRKLKGKGKIVRFS